MRSEIDHWVIYTYRYLSVTTVHSDLVRPQFGENYKEWLAADRELKEVIYPNAK